MYLYVVNPDNNLFTFTFVNDNRLPSKEFVGPCNYSTKESIENMYGLWFIAGGSGFRIMKFGSSLSGTYFAGPEYIRIMGSVSYVS